MAEQFLTLMADLDDDAQARMSGWYQSLKEAGFTGIQTPGLPYHISLATIPLHQEEEAAEIARKAATAFAPVSVHISHIGMFAGGICTVYSHDYATASVRVLAHTGNRVLCADRQKIRRRGV